MNDDDLKQLLAQALADHYHDQYLEAPEDAEANGFLLHELNQNLCAWGLSYLAQERDLQEPDRLRALLVESPALELLLKAERCC
jgi:hypothetical protein